MSVSIDELSTLISDIYASALDPSLWLETLTCYADLQGADAANVICRSAGDKSVEFAVAARQDPELIDAYVKYYGQLDTFLEASKNFPADVVFVGSSHVPKNTLENSEFYVDFLSESQNYYFLSPILQGRYAGSWTCPVVRNKNRHDFDARHVHLAKILTPHFQRALQIQRTLGPAALSAHAHAEVFEHLAIGVVLINRQGKVAHANRAAQTLLDLSDGISISRGELHTSRSSENRKVGQLIGTTVTAERDELTNVGGLVSIPRPRPSGHANFSIMVAPILQRDTEVAQFLIADEIRAIVFI
jgi:PAS domain-containing protein